MKTNDSGTPQEVERAKVGPVDLAAALERLKESLPAIPRAMMLHWPDERGPCRCQFCANLRLIGNAAPALIELARAAEMLYIAVRNGALDGYEAARAKVVAALEGK